MEKEPSFLQSFQNQLLQKYPTLGEWMILHEVQLHQFHIIFDSRTAFIPPEILSCPNLKILEFKNTPLEIISNLPAPHFVEHIIISNHELIEIPAWVFECHQLKSLQINDALAPMISDKILELTHLVSLNLSENHYDQIPAIIGHLNTLQVLDLSKNQFHTLPPTFQNLHNLEELDLSFSNLSELPNFIGNWQQLKRLICKYCPLRDLPDALGDLKTLSFLSLAATRISTLPPFFSNLTELHWIELDSTSIPPQSLQTLSQLQNVQSITLEDCRLDTIPASLLTIPKLERLLLGGNAIATFPLIKKIPHRLNTVDFVSVQEKNEIPSPSNPLKELPRDLFEIWGGVTLFLPWPMILDHNASQTITIIRNGKSFHLNKGSDLEAQWKNWHPIELKKRIQQNSPLLLPDLYHPDVKPHLIEILRQYSRERTETWLQFYTWYWIFPTIADTAEFFNPKEI
jgi:Leucine-rich repeat (LRR) protein